MKVKKLEKPGRFLTYKFLENLMRVTGNLDFFASLPMQSAQEVLNIPNDILKEVKAVPYPGDFLVICTFVCSELQELKQTYSRQRDRSRLNRLVLANLSRDRGTVRIPPPFLQEWRW